MSALHKIGAVLRTYRKRQNLTAITLAQRSGIHRNTLSALENGHGNVELNTLLTVCEQLGLDVSLVPSRVAALVEADARLPSLPEIRRTTFGRAELQEQNLSRTLLQRRVANRLTDKKEPELARADQTPGKRSPGILNQLSGTADRLRDREQTALQRRVKARLLQSGSRNVKEKK